jgi:hypothetical protein
MKVGEVMIESLFVKPENIGVTALVFHMTGCTLIGARIIRFAVKTGSGIDIGGHVLMAIKTKRPLSRPVEYGMAGRTLCFDIGMATYNVPGHDQGFNGLGSGSVTYETAKHHNQSG